jgi:DNA-binding MarR family transcriptional regulator
MSIDIKAVADLFATSSLGAPENAVGFVLWRVMHRYQRAVDRTLAPLDLTHLQFTTLAMAAWMCRFGEPATQAELARNADIHPMQISLMLKALEDKGMVARPRSAVDTRTKRVEITTAGLTALRATMPMVIGLQQRMFGRDGAPGGALLANLRAVEARGD